MANFNFNKVILGGRLTADPELKTTPSGISVTSFTIAVNRRFGAKAGAEEPQADFFNVTAWRQTAEFITRYFRKASSICVMGSIQTRTWIDQQGMKRFATEIVADEAFFVDAKSESPLAVQQAAAMYSQNAYGQAPAMGQAPSYMPDNYGSYGSPAPAPAAAPAPANGGYAAAPAPKFEEIADDDELPF
ncbi:MAG: single-stranded DNA-binding protein [Clostridia bacterium]|nr:single-stranded DNA-binding protein [Clostridia bacterium]MBQ3591454.1 single-stranded DNA-binding protein [Clostridia bacterium]MBQ4606311.1 single-stranded DNA-binding protein [Clostridia bacterium]